MNNDIQVKIIEVGPRDGLQNEPKPIPTPIKIDLVNKLSKTGLKTIEVASFVSKEWIPQMQDAKDVYEGIDKELGIEYPVLIPNLAGLHQAIESGVKEIAVFTSASEQFVKNNINCSIKQSMQNIEAVINLAKQHSIKVRGYLSCVCGCPYQGEISYSSTASLAKDLLSLGCFEISLGDTIGIGTTKQAKELIDTVTKDIDNSKLAVHFHDTHGQALANIYACLEQGITNIDSSINGLGGCPYAKGARGNVATEDVVYMLHGMGIDTGIDFDKLLDVSYFVAKIFGHTPKDRV